MKITKDLFYRKSNIVILYVMLAVIASLQSYDHWPFFDDQKSSSNPIPAQVNTDKESPNDKSLHYKNGFLLYHTGSVEYTRYNNFLIFKFAHQHLSEKRDLYKLYPDEYFDLYKYTPGFAYFFGIFKAFPDLPGLILWNLLNSLFLLFAVYHLPGWKSREKAIILFIAAIEMMTSLQNEQSNGLLAGLLILGFCLMESKNLFWASLCLVSSVFIKLFGVLAFVLVLFYPGKFRFICYSLFWTLVWSAVPLIYLNISEYQDLLQSYLQMLSNDHSESYGISLMGILHSWTGMEHHKIATLVIGFIIFLLPYMRISQYSNYVFRELSLCALLIWLVIFNHKAESPTFIIAMSGIAIWFMNSPKNGMTSALFVLAFLLISITPTDLFPRYLLNAYVKPYQLKALPAVLIWMSIIYTLLTTKQNIPTT